MNYVIVIKEKYIIAFTTFETCWNNFNITYIYNDKISCIVKINFLYLLVKFLFFTKIYSYESYFDNVSENCEYRFENISRKKTVLKV